MATVGIKIFKHHKKADGTYNVKVRVAHKGEKRYIDTPHFVIDKQITAKLALKDATVKQLINVVLDEYRISISKLGPKLDLFNAESLKEYLRGKEETMDFFKFCNKHIEELKNLGRRGSAGTLQTVLFSLNDFFKRPSVSPLEVNEMMLLKYETYLRANRTITRQNKDKKVTRTVKGMNDAAIHNHFRDFRILFKAAMKHYNKPQFGDIKIPYCPFDNYKIVDAPLTKKRNLTVEQLKLIWDCNVDAGSRAELAKELFMLSFYMCGMNAADIYYLACTNIVNNRLEYNRRKTQSRRADKAFISVKIIKEAKPLILKYLEKIHKRYACHENLDRAINEGFKQINKKIGLDNVSFYWARHSFANLARNKCQLSKDDIAEALNHVEQGHKTTDIYIAKEWVIIDKVQAEVIKLFSGSVDVADKKTGSSDETRKTMRIL